MEYVNGTKFSGRSSLLFKRLITDIAKELCFKKNSSWLYLGLNEAVLFFNFGERIYAKELPYDE